MEFDLLDFEAAGGAANEDFAKARAGSGERDVLDLIDRLNASGKTIVLVTHDEKVAARAHRVIHMKDGKVERDVYNR